MYNMRIRCHKPKIPIPASSPDVHRVYVRLNDLAHARPFKPPRGKFTQMGGSADAARVETEGRRAEGRGGDLHPPHLNLESWNLDSYMEHFP